MALDLGKLLRLHAMSEASQVDVTREAGRAMYLAYENIVVEVHAMLSELGDEKLRAEFGRVFPPMAEPPPQAIGNAQVQLARSTEALVKLRQLTGWLQGLIDHATLEQRMRIDAEERAKFAEKRTGF